MTSVRLFAPHEFQGRVELHTLQSSVLRDNPLGDPSLRELPLYVPPEPWPAVGLPVVFVLAGFTGRGQSYLETHPWRRGLVRRYDDALAAGELPPAVLVMPDCFTRLGGSQYVNSSAVGRYEDHVADELVPFVDAHPAVARDRRAVCGKSSGGFGALHLVLERPGLFGACASISGDCDFRTMFPPEFLACLRGLVPYDMDPAKFLEAFRALPDLDGDGHAVINVLAMAACYSPRPDGSGDFDLPFELETGELLPAVWKRWLAFDPLERVASKKAELAHLKVLHLECGLADQFHLQWGARKLSKALTAAGVEHAHEEHAGSHFGLDDRLLRAIGKLTTALAS